MIDDTLTQFLAFTLGNKAIEANPEFARKEALTAIYEIGLECIGEDEVLLKSGEKNRVHTIRNELRASQRKAWAKACGVTK